MPEPQSYKNYARLDPPFHFFVLPVLLINVILAIATTIHHWPQHWVLFCWWIVVSIVLFLGFGKARSYALKAQDRIIRLEEQLRFATLLPPDVLARSRSLTEAQYIALRFCCDEEAPALVKRTLDENLEPKQIKQAIVTWRGDYYRV